MADPMAEQCYEFLHILQMWNKLTWWVPQAVSNISYNIYTWIYFEVPWMWTAVFVYALKHDLKRDCTLLHMLLLYAPLLHNLTT